MQTTLVTGIIIFSIFASSCKTTPKTNHLAWMDDFKDPALRTIPDSLKYLVPVLDTILRNDQKYRSTTDRSLFRKNMAQQKKLDSINLIKVTRILDNHGWLNWQDVGLIGEKAINMTMIHSPVHVKLKYYPLLVEAFKNQKVPGESLALYEDKMNLLLHRQQYYGSQVSTINGKSVPYPIYDPAAVEKRRAALKMLPMSAYLQLFKAGWDSAAYRIQLPALKKELKVSDTTPVHIDLDGFIRLQKMEKSNTPKR